MDARASVAAGGQHTRRRRRPGEGRPQLTRRLSTHLMNQVLSKVLSEMVSEVLREVLCEVFLVVLSDLLSGGSVRRCVC